MLCRLCSYKHTVVRARCSLQLTSDQIILPERAWLCCLKHRMHKRQAIDQPMCPCSSTLRHSFQDMSTSTELLTELARLASCLWLQFTSGDQHTATGLPSKAAAGLLSDMSSMEGVGHLVLRVSQAGQHGDMFKLFAEHVMELVPDLTHIRC